MYSSTLFGVKYKQIVTLTTCMDSLKNVLQLLNQLFFAKLCLLLGLLVSSFKYAKIWRAWSVNRSLVVSPKINILPEGNFDTQIVQKSCLKWSAKRQSPNPNSQIANSSPNGDSNYNDNNDQIMNVLITLYIYMTGFWSCHLAIIFKSHS